MKMMIMKTMMSISMICILMKSPMSMMFILLIQTLLSVLIMNMINSSSWIPMITFLTMIGGLMIIFMYMSSITSNEKFKLNLKMTFIMIMTFMMTEDMIIDMPNQEFQMIQNSLDNMMSMNKMYSKSMTMTTMMIMYLLLTMISVNKIIKLFEGPLRSKTYEQI
uniref:NADH dehydrogenase subunit 6 n=1 Tax=Gargara genistae TaxID=1464907 RepID=UPI001EDE3269|nr:NADH dehydrogenase subunit 6 [Gargara genistae]UKB86919.1 NADH dehydrogenase subunit 6 [Gargara genistae]